ncbi:hypothetical protein LXL04_000614 [Taraxacum kok-saghyz]
MLWKCNSSKKVVDDGTKPTSVSCKYFLPTRYLKHAGGWMMAFVCFVVPRKRSSTKISSSGTPKRLSLSPVDNERAEAIKDCIKFINSSSSSTVSKSVPS